MGMTRQERIALHKKQERLQVKDGTPTVADLKEGVPVLRSTPEGVVEYVRHNGVLFKQILKREHEFKINKLTDSTGGTVSDSVSVSAGGAVNDIASLAAKINRIIEVLHLDDA